MHWGSCRWILHSDNCEAPGAAKLLESMEVKWLELISDCRVSDWQHGSRGSFNGGGSAMGGVLHSNTPLFWATFHPAFGSNNAPECIKLKVQNVNIDRKSSISIDKFKKYRYCGFVLRFKYFPLKRQLFWTTFQLNFGPQRCPIPSN